MGMAVPRTLDGEFTERFTVMHAVRRAKMEGDIVMTEVPAKKVWAAPKLVVYGTLEEITLGCNKTYGSSDGFLFQGQAIICSGSS
jgi:hypothetical protein